jgi:hypothetical protein
MRITIDALHNKRDRGFPVPSRIKTDPCCQPAYLSRFRDGTFVMDMGFGIGAQVGLLTLITWS